MDFRSFSCYLFQQLSQRGNARDWAKYILCECVQRNQLPDGHLLHISVIDLLHNFGPLTSVSVRNIAPVIDDLHVEYAVEWPTCVAIDEQLINEYYTPFLHFIAKLNIAAFSLSQLNAKGLRARSVCSGVFARVQCLRQWVLKVLRALSWFFLPIVEKYFSYCLQQRVIVFTNMKELNAEVKKYLQVAKMMCLMTPEKVHRGFQAALTRIWDMCDLVRLLWERCSLGQANDKDVDRAIQLYSECMWLMSSVLQVAIREQKVETAVKKFWMDMLRLLEGYKKKTPVVN